MQTKLLISLTGLLTLTPAFADNMQITCRNDDEKVVLLLNENNYRDHYVVFYNQSGLGPNNMESSYSSKNENNHYIITPDDEIITETLLSDELKLTVYMDKYSNEATLLKNDQIISSYTNCTYDFIPRTEKNSNAKSENKKKKKKNRKSKNTTSKCF